MTSLLMAQETQGAKAKGIQPGARRERLIQSLMTMRNLKADMQNATRQTQQAHQL
jgi:hypothetical protein